MPTLNWTKTDPESRSSIAHTDTHKYWVVRDEQFELATFTKSGALHKRIDSRYFDTEDEAKAAAQAHADQ
jgi:hypothetical protein